MLKKNKAYYRDNIAGFLFMLPGLLGFIILILCPVIFSLGLSMSSWDLAHGFGGIEFNGLDNFKTLIKDKWFLSSMKNTIIFAVTTVPASLILGIVFATLINKFAYLKSYLKVAFFIPYISSVVASAVIWLVFLHPINSPINQFLIQLGVENVPKWFVDMKWALPSVIMFAIWQQMGYFVLVYVAGLKNIPNELYEASEIDGANEWQKFFRITIPLVSPTTFFLTILGIIGSFKVFDQIVVLTEGGPGTSTTVVAYYIYREAFRYSRMGTASAAAWIMFMIIFIITLVQWCGQKKWVSY